ncbi:MAG: hypothetical protein B7Z66_00530 [Chromatiales bacterium 21-64-14]|nr:MAG: hypothetical protein B7Z66_00530 [Chromatiales bacterium 21-64-14]HQU15515.1 hypothetical protein [Gammaproteobacteria bacterium]
MTDRNFRSLFGFLLLVALYLESQAGLLGLVTLLFLEGVTGRRLSWLAIHPRSGGRAPPGAGCGALVSAIGPPISFDAERAWRIVASIMLVLTVQVFPTQLWFFPWFMGFTILGAGVSGVCPVLILLQLIGFR